MTRPTRRPAPATNPTTSDRILGDVDASLLDIVDNVLNKGVVLTGDITIGLAQVDLVYARLSLLLCAADRVMPSESEDLVARNDARRRRPHEPSGTRDRSRPPAARRRPT